MKEKCARWFLLGILAGWASIAVALGAFLMLSERRLSSDSQRRHDEEVAERVAATVLRPPELTRADLGAFDYSWSVEWGADRELHDFEAMRGRVLVISFWATWCVPCFAEFPTLSKLTSELPADELTVIALSVDALDPFQAFLREGRFRPPGEVARVASELSPNFWPRTLPTTWIVGPDGTIVARHAGAANWSDPSVPGFVRDLMTEE